MRFRRRLRRFRRRRRFARRRFGRIPRAIPFHRKTHNVTISHSMTVRSDAIYMADYTGSNMVFQLQDFPWAGFSNGGGGSPQLLDQWNSFSHVFDSYRVNAMKIKYYPRITANAAGFDNETYVAGILNPAMYCVVDYNSPALSDITNQDSTPDYPGSATEWARFRSCKTYNMYQPWKRFIKFRRNIPIASVDNTRSIQVNGYQETDLPMSTQCVVLGFEGVRPPDNPLLVVQLGEIHVTYYISFKDLH